MAKNKISKNHFCIKIFENRKTTKNCYLNATLKLFRTEIFFCEKLISKNLQDKRNFLEILKIIEKIFRHQISKLWVKRSLELLFAAIFIQPIAEKWSLKVPFLREENGFGQISKNSPGQIFPNFAPKRCPRM